MSIKTTNLFLGILVLSYSCSSPEKIEIETTNTVEVEAVITFNINVSADEGGSIDNIGGTFESDTSITITATPDSGYQFQGWSNGSTENPITITINESISLVAQFSQIEPSRRNFNFDNVKSFIIQNPSQSSKIYNQNSVNIKVINFNNEVSDVEIPNASSYNLNVTDAFKINEQFAVLRGDFNISFVDGTSFQSIVLLVNTETGDFYVLQNDYFGFSDFLGRNNPFGNVALQTDEQQRVYFRSNHIGDGIHSIRRLDIQLNGDNAIGTIDELNCIAIGDHRFSYLVSLEGDIFYLFNPNIGGYENRFRFRKSSGETFDLSDYGYIGKVYDYVQLGNDDNFYIFRPVRLEPNADYVYEYYNYGDFVTNENGFSDYDIFKLTSTSNGIQLDSIQRITPQRSDNNQINNNAYGPLRIHSRYAYSSGLNPSLYFEKNKDGFSHYYQFVQFSNFGVVLSEIIQSQNDSNNFQIKAMFSPLIDYGGLLGAVNNPERLTEHLGKLLITQEDNIVEFDLDNLTSSNFIENSNIQFSGLLSQSDNSILFWGFSLQNSQKVLGQIDENKAITILETIPNDTTIYEAIRIGSLGN
ncbi:hypothetical protein OAC16_02935 [Flavobacteriaceae bacterium]|nr:hypothetical protein [Flavobacteriaceae bacterium]